MSDWTEPITFATTAFDIAKVDFGDYKLVYIPSAITGGMTDAKNAALIARKIDLADFINNQGGSLIALVQGRQNYVLSNAYQWLPKKLLYTGDCCKPKDGTKTLPLTLNSSSSGDLYSNVTVTPIIDFISPNSTSISMSHYAWHGYVTGPADWSGVDQVLAYKSIRQDAVSPATARGICTQTSGQNQYCQVRLFYTRQTYTLPCLNPILSGYDAPQLQYDLDC